MHTAVHATVDEQVNIKYLRTKPGWAVIKEWIAKRITQLLGLEEEVLIGMVFNLLEVDEVRLQLCAVCSPACGCRPPGPSWRRVCGARLTHFVACVTPFFVGCVPVLCTSQA